MIDFILVAVHLHLLLEVDGKRKESRPLDLDLDFGFALPCLEAFFRAEDETIVNVCQSHPNGELATTAETSETAMDIHMSKTYSFYSSVDSVECPRCYLSLYIYVFG